MILIVLHWIEEPSFCNISRMFCSWYHTTCILPHVPGYTHDNTVADWGGPYDKLEKVYNKIEMGLKYVINSILYPANIEFLIKTSQDSHTVTYEQQVQDLVVKREATSILWLAEWRMRAVQSSLLRLKHAVVHEEHGEQKIIVTCIPILYNLRARLLGINQVRTVFLNCLDCTANVEFVPIVV